jgi:hypothetical protein
MASIAAKCGGNEIVTGAAVAALVLAATVIHCNLEVVKAAQLRVITRFELQIETIQLHAAVNNGHKSKPLVRK